MQIDMNGVIYALSYALDCIEAEVVGVSVDHAKWVAYLATVIGKQYGYSTDALLDLSACAALHDNALTQYLSEEHLASGGDLLGAHSTFGEMNTRCFPFRTNTNGWILYHHENADGTGPFKKRISEIPVQAHIIHLADMADVACHFHEISHETYSRVLQYVTQQRDQMYDGGVIDAFLSAMPESRYLSLSGRKIDDILNEELPHTLSEYPFEKVKTVMDVFGKIVDYKSKFTHNHSDGIAHKVVKMAQEYGYDRNVTERLYLAGALHDIGKMAIRNDILEKPDKLTADEFSNMQNHAWYTYVILKKINGFDDIAEWASFHHEKLNGKGYPFGKTAEQLTEKDRLMACVDIYQALREDRPYKSGMPHEKCIAIMTDMVSKGFIDGKITSDIDRVFKDSQ